MSHIFLAESDFFSDFCSHHVEPPEHADIVIWPIGLHGLSGIEGFLIKFHIQNVQLYTCNNHSYLKGYMDIQE